MAESGSGSKGTFAKVFQKRVVRTKEKVLQNLGKADKTTDDVFDEHVTNFHKQQAAAEKLHKELQKYITCVKAMSTASKAFYAVVSETYEQEWVGHREITEAVGSLGVLVENYQMELVDRVQTPLVAYKGQFPDVKNKIAKRGRKLVDFDSTRHNLASLQSAKKKDEMKINRAEEELRDAKKIYEDLNNELHEELPALYDNRINVLSSNMHSLFSVEAKFEEESAKLKYQMSDIADRLAAQSSHTTLNIRQVTNSLKRYPCTDLDLLFWRYKLYRKYKPQSRTSMPSGDSARRCRTLPRKPMSLYGTYRLVNRGRDTEGSEHGSDRVEVNEASSRGLSTHYKVGIPNDVEKEHVPSDSEQKSTPRTSTRSEDDHPVPSPRENHMDFEATAAVTTNGDIEEKKEEKRESGEHGDVAETSYEAISVGAQVAAEKEHEVSAEIQKKELDDDDTGGVYSAAADVNDIYRIPSSNAPVDPDKLPDGVIYQVEATHPYTGEDTDELSFEAGMIINVVPFEDPEEQDEGWLMGMKVGSSDKGVFPANFTKRI